MLRTHPIRFLILRPGFEIKLGAAAVSLLLAAPVVALNNFEDDRLTDLGVDLVSSSAGSRPIDAVNAIYVPSPQLSQISQGGDVAYYPILVAAPGAVIFHYQTKFAANNPVGGIAVIYPDIGEPFRSVFTQIIDGIESHANGHVVNYPVRDNVDTNALNLALRNQNTKVVIALGQHGLKVASQLDKTFDVVVGGVLNNAENQLRNVQVNTLAPDPDLLFGRLKAMMPKIKKIYTVYNPQHNSWMIQLAKQAAKEQGLTLVSYEAGSLRDAVAYYQSIFANIDVQQEALWLLQDPTTVDESTVLPMVLQVSWSKAVPVFSSSFAHVRRGVLFSLYPNNEGLGRHLAGSALNFLTNGNRANSNLLPLREVLMAINIRTARHLGVDLDRAPRFDLSFPER